MPIINVTLIEGYGETTKTELSRKLTNAACAVTGAQPDGVTVVLNEVSSGNYMRGGEHKTPGIPPLSASEIVRAYLTAMEERDLSKAGRYLAEEFHMNFPGGVKFTKLEELVAWGKTRYQFVKKSYQKFDECETKSGVAVYCYGTLAGVFPDETPFNGIRFIDRFLVSGNKLVDQLVWNDLGLLAKRQR